MSDPLYRPQQAAGREEEEVVLFRTDQSGRAWPVNAPTELLEPKGGRRKKQLVKTNFIMNVNRYSLGTCWPTQFAIPQRSHEG